MTDAQRENWIKIRAAVAANPAAGMHSLWSCGSPCCIRGHCGEMFMVSSIDEIAMTLGLGRRQQNNLFFPQPMPLFSPESATGFSCTPVAGSPEHISKRHMLVCIDLIIGGAVVDKNIWRKAKSWMALEDSLSEVRDTPLLVNS